ncbi:MAG TPA: hypothetical protein P5077_06090 [bacterium]|nr:hypothetical protein [bacterium]
MRILGIAAIVPLICVACEFTDGPNYTAYEPPSYQWGALDGESDVFAKAIALDENGDVYVAGLVQGHGLLPDAEGSGPLFLTKFHGIVPQWTLQRDEGVVATLTSDGSGHLYAAGISDNNAGIILLRFTTDGVFEWSVRWRGITTGFDAAYAITRIPTGELLVAGVTGIDAGELPTVGDAVVVTFSPDGAVIKESIWGSDGTDVALAIAVASDGSRYVTGYTTGTMEGQTAGGGEDLFVTKLDVEGAPLWHRQFGLDYDDRGTAIAVDSKGAVLVTGYRTMGGSYGEVRQAVLLGFSTDGEEKFTTIQPDKTAAYSLAFDAEGNVYTFGESTGYFPMDKELIEVDPYKYMDGPLLLAKWKSDGTFVDGVKWGDRYSNDPVLPAAMVIHNDTVYAVSSVIGEYTTPRNSIECRWRRCAVLSMIDLNN